MSDDTPSRINERSNSDAVSRRDFIGAAVLGAGAASLATSVAHADQAISPSKRIGVNLRGLDSWVTAVMAHWKVPGVAIGAVKNGEVVLAKGFGYRDVERKLPVTAQTLFAVASNTKSVTGLILGTLVDEKKLEWDRPVRDYLADFRLFDDIASRLVTARDLLSHRSGLPGHDGLFHGRSYTRQELYERLRFLEPNVTFRQRHQYNNLMFMAAGVLAERISGQSWEDLVRQRVFAPLGMTRSNLSITDMQRDEDYSHAHAEVANQVVPIPLRNMDAVGPAGSINSSVAEMIRYLQLRINLGSYGGRTIVSAETAEELQSPQSAEDHAQLEYPELGPGTYGLGVQLHCYRGHKIVYHGGGIDGFLSSMTWFPEDQLGVIVLTNSIGEWNVTIPPVFRLVAHEVIDRLLGLPPVDWFAQERERYREAQTRAAERKQKESAQRVSGTTPTHALAAYTGDYEHPGYGRISVTESEGRLNVTLDHLTLPLEHLYYDVFKTIQPGDGRWQWGIGASRRVTFGYSSGGRIERLEVNLEETVSDIVFTRK